MTFPSNDDKAIMTKLIKYALFLATILVTPQALVADSSSAKSHYSKAIELLKSKDRSRMNEVTEHLKKARAIAMSAHEKSNGKHRNSLLQKINALLYWQHKFSTFERFRSADEKGEKEVLTKAIEANTPQVRESKSTIQGEFEKKLAEVQAYENKNQNDHYNNMINYMGLQDLIYDSQSGKNVFSKAQRHRTNYTEESKAIRERILDRIPFYKQIEKNRDYAELKRRVRHLLKTKKLDYHEKMEVVLYYKKIHTLAKVKDMLIDHEYKHTRYEDDFAKISAVVESANETGLNLFTGEDGKMMFISWAMTPEITILKLASQVLDKSSEHQLFLLALMNLELKRYVQGYDLFMNIVEQNPTKIVHYSKYLEECEQGYRLTTGKLIEKELDRAVDLLNEGRSTEAKRVLNLLLEDHMNHPLASMYLRRYKVTYADVMNG